MGIFDWLRKSTPRQPSTLGTTPATAIAVEDVSEEYAWARQHYPDWTFAKQSCTEIDDRRFDILTIRAADGREQDIYFDISGFLPPDRPARVAAASTTTRPSPATDAGATMFPLDRAEQYLRKTWPDLERDGSRLRWSDHDGLTELRIEPSDHRTHDGLLVRELVTLTHTAPCLDSSAALAPQLNRWATLSTLISGDATTPTRLVCKVGIFDGDHAAAERLYAPLIANEAAIIGWHAMRLAHGPMQIDPDRSPLSYVRDAPTYDAADFAAAKAFTDRLSALGNTDASGFTVEFPWDDGAVSRMFALPDFRANLRKSRDYAEAELDRMAGRTSLLQIVIDQPHSLYGNGVMVRLELPLDSDHVSGSTLIDELNRWELSGNDLPPLFGAWCLGPRAPTFVTFVPNHFCQGVRGLPQNLAVWANVRHQRVRQWLQASSTPN